MSNRVRLYLLCMFLVLSIASCKKDEDTPTPTPDNTRALAIEDYKNNYLKSEISLEDLKWSGGSSNCDAGTVSDIAHERIAQRVNYFRRATGLPSKISIDTEFSKICQDAALMCHANNDILHFPPKTWKCYTESGAKACRLSNLAYNYSSSAKAITGFMDDKGSTSLGHRRWILYSGLGNIGHGSTTNTVVLGVLNTKGGTDTGLPEFTSWPPKGYAMAPLVFSDWSFSIPGRTADFSKAKVVMLDDKGAAVKFSINPSELDSGYGDNTVSWRPENIIKNSPQDVTYKIKVSDVLIDATPKTYEYTVTIVQP